ncbi:hypothetical protein [Pseudogulbenkiania sp. NH8B]|uniref:hypothetical protein n=1 Tax=Pseudogulbenkiania sp. (strain NH8B) TaxID=748280 RepID=UPI0011D1E80B|nr:hypothetical protein [Pseudogulbenkiania sp. NH8B]
MTARWKTEIRVVIGFAAHFQFSVLAVLLRCGRLQAPYYKEWFAGNKTTPDGVGMACGGDATPQA